MGMKKKSIIFFIGLFLIIDGLGSLYWGNNCLSSCSNNNIFGNIVRIIRTVAGGYLVYKF